MYILQKLSRARIIVRLRETHALRLPECVIASTQRLLSAGERQAIRSAVANRFLTQSLCRLWSPKRAVFIVAADTLGGNYNEISPFRDTVSRLCAHLRGLSRIRHWRRAEPALTLPSVPRSRFLSLKKK